MIASAARSLDGRGSASVGRPNRRRNVMHGSGKFGLAALCVTALNAVLWWLNERVGVAYLQNSRRQLMARTGIEGMTE